MCKNCEYSWKSMKELAGLKESITELRNTQGYCYNFQKEEDSLGCRRKVVEVTVINRSTRKINKIEYKRR